MKALSSSLSLSLSSRSLYQFGKLILTNLLLLSLVLFNGCGQDPQNKIVKDVAIKTALDNGDVLLNLSAQFDLKNMSMTSIKLPITDPYDPNRVYGVISFLPTMDGTYNEIGVTVNLSQASQLPGAVATLPNNEPLPIGGIDSAKVLELKIDQIHSKVYLALDHDLVLFGFAISIKEFDTVAQYVGGANIFLGFDIKGVKGMAGLYTSKDVSYESGLGFFVDLSSVISPDLLNDIISGKKLQPTDLEKGYESSSWTKDYKDTVSIRLKDKKPSKAKQERFAKIWNKLSKENIELHPVPDVQ